MNLMGMDVGELRMPLFPMSDANRSKLIAALKKAGLL
jgi:dihydrodipicolinate synthase/N-acetylneuraminate lyase